MLRVVLTLDCDKCKQSYWQAAVCTDPEPFFGESFASDLQNCAGDHGWMVGEKLGAEMLCNECVEEMEGQSEEVVYG